MYCFDFTQILFSQSIFGKSKNFGWLKRHRCKFKFKYGKNTKTLL
jgi:hypothetical protein